MLKACIHSSSKRLSVTCLRLSCMVSLVYWATHLFWGNAIVAKFCPPFRGDLEHRRVRLETTEKRPPHGTCCLDMWWKAMVVLGRLVRKQVSGLINMLAHRRRYRQTERKYYCGLIRVNAIWWDQDLWGGTWSRGKACKNRQVAHVIENLSLQSDVKPCCFTAR